MIAVEEPAMNGIAAACALACVFAAGGAHAFATQEDEEPTIEQELAALIEKTNALETFHVVYDIDNTATGLPARVSMEIMYRAPGTGRVRASSDQGDTDVWLIDDGMYVWANREWRSSELPGSSDSTRAVEDLMPRSGALEPGVTLSLGITGPDDAPVVSLNVSPALFDRTAVLHWLLDMKRDFSNVTVEGELLAWNMNGAHVLVSRDTGFIQSIDVVTEKGEAHVDLRSFSEALGEELLTLPREAREGKVDAALTRPMAAVLPDVCRTEALGRALDMTEAGREEDARRAWRLFLEVMHREKMDARYPKWIENVREEVEKKSSTMREKRASDDSPEGLDKLRELVATERASLEQGLDEDRGRYLELLSSRERRPYEDLASIEQEVVRELYDEIVRQPILDHYDEAMKAVVDE